VKDPPNWVIYNLPDGLWFYALISTLALIWDDKSSKYFNFWFFSAIILSYLSEFFQALHLIPGTFDWRDLFAYSIAVIIYNFTFLKFHKPISVNT
jgi:hypothetical protein